MLRPRPRGTCRARGVLRGASSWAFGSRRGGVPGWLEVVGKLSTTAVRFLTRRPATSDLEAWPTSSTAPGSVGSRSFSAELARSYVVPTAKNRSCSTPAVSSATARARASNRALPPDAMQAGPIGGTRLLEAATAKHAKSAHEIAVHHDVREAVSVEIGDNGAPTETLLGIT